MILHTLRRLRRTPVPALGVLFFAAILSVVLCGLQKANDAELEKYNDTYHTIPVQFSVTNLSATTSSNLDIPAMIADVFIQEDGLAKYVSDLQRVCKHAVAGINSNYTLVGITSTALSNELWPENGTYILWNEGYGEKIFSSNDSVCLVPNSMMVLTDEGTGAAYVELDFECWKNDPMTEYSCKLKVVGTYMGGDGKSIYCPYAIGEQVYAELEEFMSVQAIRATLRNNDDLEELRTVSKRWFSEPNPLGEKTLWGEFGYDYYLYALDINDDLLQRSSVTLQNSISTNRICTVIVLCLSAAAGFLIGFLMVRNRKKEIALMRTMGTPNRSIYFGFTLEQMLCVVLGIVLGGSYNGWHPADRLGILAVIYFVGLTVALQIFLHKNLLTTIKEDE